MRFLSKILAAILVSLSLQSLAATDPAQRTLGPAQQAAASAQARAAAGMKLGAPGAGPVVRLAARIPAMRMNLAAGNRAVSRLTSEALLRKRAQPTEFAKRTRALAWTGSFCS